MLIATTKKQVVTFNWASKDSPLWGVLKVFINTSVVAFLLWVFADKFDTGEIKTLVMFLIGNTVTEGVNVRTKMMEHFKRATKNKDRRTSATYLIDRERRTYH